MKRNLVQWMFTIGAVVAAALVSNANVSAQSTRTLYDSGFSDGGRYITDEGLEADAGQWLETSPIDSPWSSYGSEHSPLPDYRPVSRTWVQADYLMWWVQGTRTPPLLTTSPTGTPRAEAGVLGFPDTEILFGGERLDDDIRHGGRLNVGYWFDDCQSRGLQFHFFGLGGDDTNRTFASDGDPILARPFFNVDIAAEDALLVAFPDVVDGWVNFQTDSELYSTGLLLRQTWYSGTKGHVDFVGGYRYLQFREGLDIEQRMFVRDPEGFVQLGTQIDLRDSFRTRTDFHGGEVGLASQWVRGAFSLNVLTKLAIGGVRQVSRVDGATTVTEPGEMAVGTAGGLLAQPSNIGRGVRYDFALLPELDVSVNGQLTERVAVNVGYNLLFLTEAMRTGDLIDRAVDPTQVVANGGEPNGAARPLHPQDSTSLWIQGLHLGAVVEF